jgi:hypothetical protein
VRIRVENLLETKTSAGESFNLCPAVDCQRTQDKPGFSNCADSAPLPVEQSKFTIVDSKELAAHHLSLIAKLTQFVRQHEIGIAGIEFVEDDSGQLYVYDVNACNTNYNTDAETRAGLAFADTGPGRVALYLQRERPSVESA